LRWPLAYRLRYVNVVASLYVMVIKVIEYWIFTTIISREADPYRPHPCELRL